MATQPLQGLSWLTGHFRCSQSQVNADLWGRGQLRSSNSSGWQEGTMSSHTCTGSHTPQSERPKALPPAPRRTSPPLSSCPRRTHSAPVQTGYLTTCEDGCWPHGDLSLQTLKWPPKEGRGPTVLSGERGRFSPVHSSVWKGPGRGADNASSQGGACTAAAEGGRGRAGGRVQALELGCAGQAGCVKL